MAYRFLLATFLVFACEILARANSPYEGLNMRVRVEGIEEFPQFDFYLKYREFAQDGAEAMRLSLLRPGEPALLEAKRVEQMVLLAVPRGQGVQIPEAKADGDAWLKNVPAGGLQSDVLKTPEDAEFPGKRFDSRRHGTVIVYRVQIDNGKLIATCVEWKSRYETLRESCIVTCFVISAVLSALVVGILIVLKVRLRRQSQMGSPS
jgi:hypothetical protein